MHIVIGFLTSLLTILYLLDRLGINLGGFNPFYWRRRRAWLKKYRGDTIYAVEDPMEVAALFVVGVAKIDGDITAEEKKSILAEFSSNFSLSEREASQLLGSSAHLLGQPQLIGTQLSTVLGRLDDLFTPDQAESLVAMMSTVVSSNEQLSSEQADLIESVRDRFSGQVSKGGTWVQRNLTTRFIDGFNDR